MSSSAKILLYTSKTYKDEKHPVLLRIVIDRKPMYYNIGSNLKCVPDLWDSAKCEFKKKFPNYQEANRNLHAALKDAEAILINLQYENPNFSHADFKVLFSKKHKKIFFFKYMDELIIRKQQAGKIGSAEIYKSAKRALFQFFKKEMELSDLNVKNLTLFIEDCQNKGQKPNSIGFHLSVIRAVFNRAIKEEGYEHYPFKGFSWKPLINKTQKRAISKNDIKRIMNFEADPGTDLFNASKFFAFMYLTYGLNYSDLAKIEEANIKKVNEISILIYERSKGGKLYQIPLSKEAIEILDYYRDKNNDSKYIFPILNEHIHVTPQQIKHRIKNMLHKYNTDLDTIAEKLEISEKVTSYVARHTFASVLAKSGTSVFTISEMMGHSKLTTTQIYLKELDYSSKIEASKNLTD